MNLLAMPARFRGLVRGRAWFYAILIFCGGVGLADVPAHGADGGPHVVRTMVHHQVTAVDSGVWAHVQPVVSDGGNRIVFMLNKEGDGQPYRLAAVDFEDGGVTVLAAENGIAQPDMTADGSRVIYVLGYAEIRSVAGDGTGLRTLLKSIDGGVDCPRISGDGRVIVFLVTRGMTLRVGDKNQVYDRGVYAMNPDGGNLRRVAGPDEVARAFGVRPDEVGNPNFTLGYLAGSLDVSSDGRRVAFGCWVKGVSTLIGCDITGRNLHAIVQRQPVIGGGAPHQFTSIALSGDGTTVVYHTNYPDQLGVAGFDGKWDKVLLAANPDDWRFGWPSSAPVYVTLDGARVTYAGRQFNADGSGAFQLMSTHQEGVLRYLEYEQPAPDAQGRRFAYWVFEAGLVQLATIELNVPFERLRGAPKVSELILEPPAIPRERKDVNIVRSKLAAKVEADPPPPSVSSTGFFNGVVDDKMIQHAMHLYDDGKADDSGDETAGDGVFSRRCLAVYEDAPDGPRTVRVEAQVIGADKLRHATVVEIGPYPIVPGSDQRPPAGTPTRTPTIDGTPPPQPTAQPHPPGTEVTGPTTTPPDSTTTTTDTPPPPGAIDLTGYWESESGALHFIRQIGNSVYWSVDALPKVRNVFVGTIDRDVLTGKWVDLPGGAIETGTGTLKLKIESNDKLTKISDSTPYDATTWVRTGKR